MPGLMTAPYRTVLDDEHYGSDALDHFCQLLRQPRPRLGAPTPAQNDPIKPPSTMTATSATSAPTIATMTMST